MQLVAVWSTLSWSPCLPLNFVRWFLITKLSKLSLLDLTICSLRISKMTHLSCKFEPLSGLNLLAYNFWILIECWIQFVFSHGAIFGLGQKRGSLLGWELFNIPLVPRVSKGFKVILTKPYLLFRISKLLFLVNLFSPLNF